MSAQEKLIMIEYALRYAALGWAVFPVKPRDKVPATPHGCLDATTDSTQIRAWWDAAPDCNIGLACGEISGVAALDIDPRSGGQEFFDAMTDENGQLPEGVFESQTGGGGTHYVFSYRGEANIDLAPGVEVKSDGKYIVIPPSIHPSGNNYEWELSSSPIEAHDNNSQSSTDAALVGGDDTEESAADIFGLFSPTRAIAV